MSGPDHRGTEFWLLWPDSRLCWHAELSLVADAPVDVLVDIDNCRGFPITVPVSPGTPGVVPLEHARWCPLKLESSGIIESDKFIHLLATGPGPEPPPFAASLRTSESGAGGYYSGGAYLALPAASALSSWHVMGFEGFGDSPGTGRSRWALVASDYIDMLDYQDCDGNPVSVGPFLPGDVFQLICDTADQDTTGALVSSRNGGRFLLVSGSTDAYINHIRPPIDHVDDPLFEVVPVPGNYTWTPAGPAYTTPFCEPGVQGCQSAPADLKDLVRVLNNDVSHDLVVRLKVDPRELPPLVGQGAGRDCLWTPIGGDSFVTTLPPNGWCEVFLFWGAEFQGLRLNPEPLTLPVWVTQYAPQSDTYSMPEPWENPFEVYRPVQDLWLCDHRFYAGVGDKYVTIVAPGPAVGYTILDSPPPIPAGEWKPLPTSGPVAMFYVLKPVGLFVVGSEHTVQGRDANGDSVPVGVWVHGMLTDRNWPPGPWLLCREGWGYAAGFRLP